MKSIDRQPQTAHYAPYEGDREPQGAPVQAARPLGPAPGPVSSPGRTDRLSSAATDACEGAPRTSAAECSIPWPAKYPVLGVGISATDYAGAAEAIIQAALQRQPAIVSCFPVHAMIECHWSDQLKAHANRFQMITCDGHPVRWALNLLHGTRLRDRVYGPHLMTHLCERAAESGVSIYLYGSTEAVIAQLSATLQKRIPNLVIAGAESPPFRKLSEEEDAEMVRRLNASGAGLIFLGLGCPKQDWFAIEHAQKLQGVQLCVGAAFDFHAGTKRMAPAWMQKRGLEWLFRLLQEPRRLAKRYFVTNTIFLWLLAKSLPRALWRRAR